MKQRADINWEEKLQPSDLMNRKEDGREIKTVLLRGLQRLAQEAGLKHSECKLEFIGADRTGTIGIMQAVYSIVFEDGSSWVGCADCNAKNTTGKFLAYPTAVAESRAEARALRKALGISLLSSEEIGFVDGGAVTQIEASSGKAIDSQVIKAIEKLVETRCTTVAELLEAILTKDRNGSVFELSELTVEEGQKAMSWLNDLKPKVKKLSAAEEREARKKELQDKQV